MPEKLYLINLDQLKELGSSRNPMAKQAILLDVMGHPYKEQSGLSTIIHGIRKILEGL